MLTSLRNIGIIHEYDTHIKLYKNVDITTITQEQSKHATSLIKELKDRNIDFDENSVVVKVANNYNPVIDNQDYVYPGDNVETITKNDKMLSGEESFNSSIMQGSTGKFFVHKRTMNGVIQWDVHMSITGPNKVEGLVGMILHATENESDIEGLQRAFSTQKRLLVEFQDGTHDLVQKDSPVELENGTLEYVDSGEWVSGQNEEDVIEFIFAGADNILKGRYVLNSIAKNRLNNAPDISTSKIYFFVKPENQNSQLKKNSRYINKDLIIWEGSEAIMTGMDAFLIDLKKIYNIERKFVTIEYPENRFVKYLVDKYEAKNAVYNNLSDGNDEYTSLTISGSELDAFIIDGKLILFFDNIEEVEKILGLGDLEFNPYFNYKLGSYVLEMGMYGYYMSTFRNDLPTKPIFEADITNSLNIDTEVFFGKRDFYKEHNLPHKRGILLYGQPGCGKCFAKGTQILMFDGSIKNVEDVKVGDLLMGDDSYEREVMSLGRGVEMMYDVIPVKGDSYTVNESHILSLVVSGNSHMPNKKHGDKIDIPLKEYVSLPVERQVRLKGYRKGINLPSSSFYIDPYILGLWLGGMTGDLFSTGNLNDKLKKYNLINNKHIPNDYKINRRLVRLEILAGLIDSNGSICDDGYEIIQNNKQMVSDILYICRSLGFGAYSKVYENDDKYYKISINGEHLHKLPVKIEHKRLKKCGKSSLTTDITVIPKGEGEYFGFEIKGNNRRFLLGDFTVVHNTTFIKNYISKIKDKYAILIDCSSHTPDSGMFKFLEREIRDKPKILIFEDVDSIASNSSRRSAFLNFLDGVSQLDNTLVLATTNYPERLDPALLNRRSRFDKKYKIGLPSKKSRVEFLKIYFGFLNDEMLNKYADLTEGFTGADFKEIFILQNIQETSIIDAIEQLSVDNAIFKMCSPDKGHDIELVKAVDGEVKTEERITYGIVLKPEDVDSHKDIYDGETIIKAADFYMEHFGNTGLMHTLIVNKKIKILQSYTTLTNFSIDDMKGNKRKISKDTWMMKFRIIDDVIWADVKAGKLTGLSIGAIATVRDLKKMMGSDNECKEVKE